MDIQNIDYTQEDLATLLSHTGIIDGKIGKCDRSNFVTIFNENFLKSVQKAKAIVVIFEQNPNCSLIEFSSFMEMFNEYATDNCDIIFSAVYNEKFDTDTIGYKIILTGIDTATKFYANFISLTTDNNFLVTYTTNFILIFDSANMKCLKIFFTGMKTISGMTISKNQKYIAISTYGLPIRILDFESGKWIKTLSKSDGFEAICFTNDDNLLICTHNQTVKILNLESEKCVIKLKHTCYIHSLTVTKDEKYLISGEGGCNTKAIRVWDLTTKQCIGILKGHRGSVESIYITDDDKYIVSGSRDKTIKIWDIKTKKCINTISNESAYPVSKILPLHNKYIVSVNKKDYCESTKEEDEWHIKIWDTKINSECTKTLIGHNDYVKAIALSNDNRFLFSASEDQTIKKWDIEAGAVICEVRLNEVIQN